MNTCKYCNDPYDKDSEHVFPKGLGGEDVYVDFVCSDCNGKFSNLEGELFQKSFLGLERSIQEIEGYKKKGKPSPFKPSFLLTQDPTNKTVYEIGQHGKMITYLLPQLFVFNNEFYLDAESDDAKEKLNTAYKSWRLKSLRLVESVDIKEGGLANNYFQVKYDKDSTRYDLETIKEQIKVKNEIRIDYLADNRSLYEFLTPRLFLDERDPRSPRLRVRSQNQKQAFDFILQLLKYTEKGVEIFPFPDKDLKNTITYVGQNFDVRKFERALVKIGLNSLMHYFPKSKESKALTPLFNFVNGGIGSIQAKVGEKSALLDSIPNTHNIFFQQSEDHLQLRISLFNGQFVFIIVIPDLSVLPKNSFNRLSIDYKNRINKLDGQIETAKSLIK